MSACWPFHGRPVGASVTWPPGPANRLISTVTSVRSRFTPAAAATPAGSFPTASRSVPASARNALKAWKVFVGTPCS